MQKLWKFSTWSALIPLFCSSLPMFTWIKSFIFIFCFICSSDIFWASFSLSSEWMNLNSLRQYLTLFVCNFPIKWRLILLLSFKTVVHLSKASWTLFSPKSVCPCSIKFYFPQFLHCDNFRYCFSLKLSSISLLIFIDLYTWMHNNLPKDITL